MTITIPDIKTQSFALIEKEGMVTLYKGRVHEIAATTDIHALAEKENSDIVFILPYHTIRERGFESHGDEPVLALVVEEQSEPVSVATFKDTLPTADIKLAENITPSLSDDDHAQSVIKLMDSEIEAGNASQINFSRIFKGRLENISNETLAAIYKRLLNKAGQYMTVLFVHSDAQLFIIGATPECHLHITADKTTMMPIAGTLRKEDPETFEQRLQQFLTDPKEINELYQVTDEELKMMGRICPDGGLIEGPFLREIGNVIHTFYRLAGKRLPDSIDSLRHTLHAPTVVGSPMESAAHIVKKYEPESRRYYAGEIGIYNYKNRTGGYTHGEMDVAILIRCAEIAGDGTFRVQAGGGIVRDSEPASETRETRAKASVMIAALTGETADIPIYLTEDLHRKYHPLLMQRNKHLSAFWMQTQTGQQEKLGLSVSIINNEDDFAFMIAHMVRSLGCDVDVIDTFAFDETKNNSDIVIIGPGPGDINDANNKRMVALRKKITALRDRKKPLLGICLGHQALSTLEDISVVRQRRSTQGTQRIANVFGKDYRLGFYNSFSPIYTEDVAARNDLEVSTDEEGRIIAMEGHNFIGFQFHPESIMSEFGDELLGEALKRLTKGLTLS